MYLNIFISKQVTHKKFIVFILPMATIYFPENTFHHLKRYFLNCINNVISKFLYFQCHNVWIRFCELSLIIHEQPYTLNLSNETSFEKCLLKYYRISCNFILHVYYKCSFSIDKIDLEQINHKLYKTLNIDILFKYIHFYKRHYIFFII